MKAILVDDDKAMHIVLKRLLSRAGDVTVAGAFTSGADALAWVRTEPVDIVFVDIQMTDENGVDLARQLLSIRPHMRVVFVTSHREFAVDAFELGAVDYIVKPVTLERLKQTLHRLTAGRISADTAAESADKLTASCLGGLTVRSRYGDVKWRSRKSAELFAYLLMHRDKGATRDRILEDLFDGVASRQTNIYLNTAVYQLRSTLKLHGQGDAIVSINERYKLDPDAVEADFIVFEGQAAAIGEIYESNYRQACDVEKLYAGDLFSDKSYVWSIAETERLSLLYAAFAKRLGKWLLEHGHLELAAPVLGKLVAHNETDEQANALMLSLYAAAKDWHSLSAHYNKYTILLQEEFGVQPGAEITRLFERLTGGPGERRTV